MKMKKEKQDISPPPPAPAPLTERRIIPGIPVVVNKEFVEKEKVGLDRFLHWNPTLMRILPY
jgi:hypothetical protein